MKYMTKIALLLVIGQMVFARSDDSALLLQKARAKLNRVQDYSVNIAVKVDINFLKVKEMKARLYYKNPDKTKLEAKGFALIPKVSLEFSATRLLNNDFISVFVKNDTVDARPTAVIKLIPTKEGGRIILATLWIDVQDFVIRKLEAATQDKGSFTVYFKYGPDIDYGLPSEVSLLFNVKKGGFSHFSMPGQDSETEGAVKKNMKKPMQGHVQIFYSGYKINIGLKDSFFEEEEEEYYD